MRFESIARTALGWRIDGGTEARTIAQQIAEIYPAFELKLDGKRHGNRLATVFPRNQLRRIIDVRRALLVEAICLHGTRRYKDDEAVKRAVFYGVYIGMMGHWDVARDPGHPDHCRLAQPSAQWQDRLRFLRVSDELGLGTASTPEERKHLVRRSVYLHLLRLNMTVAEFKERKALFAQPLGEAQGNGRGWTIHEWINVRAGTTDRGRGNAARRRLWGNLSAAELKRNQRRAVWREQMLAPRADPTVYSAVLAKLQVIE